METGSALSGKPGPTVDEQAPETSPAARRNAFTAMTRRGFVGFMGCGLARRKCPLQANVPTGPERHSPGESGQIDAPELLDGLAVLVAPPEVALLDAVLGRPVSALVPPLDLLALTELVPVLAALPLLVTPLVLVLVPPVAVAPLDPVPLLV